MRPRVAGRGVVYRFRSSGAGERSLVRAGRGIRRLSACWAAPPERVELGRWFADFQLDGPEFPHRTLDDVAELLGEPGTTAYRKRLDEVARAGGGQWRLRWLREELVARTGDTDAMVAFLAEDLSTPRGYERIANVLREKGRTAEAIEWLERGIQSDRGWALVETLSETYAEGGRADDVVALRERHFMATGTESAYRALRDVAEKTPRWPEIRAGAFALLRKRAESRIPFAATTLARLLLDEGEVAEAWEVVQRHGCNDPATRVAIAERRGETHPGDAISVLRPLVDPAIRQTNNSGYEQAAALLATLRGLYARTGDDFATEIGRLKEAHRRKRNFLAALARHGL
jgi:uncharacterized Zn finger protein